MFTRPPYTAIHGVFGATAHAPAWRQWYGWSPRSPTQGDLLGELGERGDCGRERGDCGREREASSHDPGERGEPHEAIPLHGRVSMGGDGAKLRRVRGDRVGSSLLPGLRNGGFLSGRAAVIGRRRAATTGALVLL